MPTQKCPACGYRMLQSTGIKRCPNCRYPIQSQAGSIHLGMEGDEDAHLDTSPQMPVIIPSPGAAGKADAFAGSSSDDFFSDNDPFIDSAQSIRSDTIDAGEATSSPVYESSSAGLFRRRPPNVEGVIIQVQAQEELPSSGLADSISTIRDIIWPIYDTRQKERVLVTSLRVRDANGEQSDARLEGRLTGANITLGDRVALWGWRRKGILLIRRGYNHTSKGVIMTRAISASRGNILFFLLVVVLMIVFALASIPSFFHNMDSFSVRHEKRHGGSDYQKCH